MTDGTFINLPVDWVVDLRFGLALVLPSRCALQQGIVLECCQWAKVNVRRWEGHPTMTPGVAGTARLIAPKLLLHCYYRGHHCVGQV